mgnify:CR=1 FL=1
MAGHNSNTIKSDKLSTVGLSGDNNEIPTTPIKEDEKNIILSLKSFELAEGDYSNYFKFWVMWENKSEKNIIGMAGKLEIYDMFDDKLGTYNIQYIGLLSWGRSIEDTYYYDYNQFIDTDIKLGKSTFKDLTYKYSIDKVIYEENFNKNDKLFEKNTWEWIEAIEPKIVNKKAEKGSYGNNSVEFTLEIANKSDKVIKWIKGGYYIYDIFGNKLKWYELNVTAPINSGAVYKTTVNYDVNQFIADETSVYSTDFDYLKYNFAIEKIIYSTSIGTFLWSTNRIKKISSWSRN